MSKDTPTIRFKTMLFTIKTWTILRLPESASAKLPTRGQTMVEGTINGFEFRAPLEPDGKWSHWLHVDAPLSKAINAKAGDTVSVTITSVKAWPEPDIPPDIQQALMHAPEAHELWQHITPLARWEWIRWIRSTNRQETRQHRVEVACSKLSKGMRRPCCWNRNLSTEPYVSHNGMLLDPDEL